MTKQNLLILERSSQNLQKITRNGKTMLEGVFAEFGVENRNGRIYEEKEYLPHLEYLKKDIMAGNLLGELDHPERFEVALGNVSHRINELWYDQQKRQILGRIEILEGTPKGQIAKTLLESGVPLSISSRAAGTVNENKTVEIQQIYTYDLVAKPGFESATLHRINENSNSNNVEINKMIKVLNESAYNRNQYSLNSRFGIINENISILDLTDKYPQLNLRNEALSITKNNNNNFMSESKSQNNINESTLQQWTQLFKEELQAINNRLDEMSYNNRNKTVNVNEIKAIKKYVEKLRKIQEDSLNWQSEIAKSVNEVATYADTLAKKGNKHYNLTRKIVETVDHNSKVINKTQDWTESIANTTNAIGATVDHNAKMLNRINEWSKEKAVAINNMHEWVGSIAKATNGMHDWTSSIAKNVNRSINWSEDMFGKAISKNDAKRLVEYVELVMESKSNPKLKQKLNEMLNKHSIKSKPINESHFDGIKVIDKVDKLDNSEYDDYDTMDSGVEFDKKTNTIVSKTKNVQFGKSKYSDDDTDLQMKINKNGNHFSDSKDSGYSSDWVKQNLQKTTSIKVSNDSDDRFTSKYQKDQNLKLDTKSSNVFENLNNSKNIKDRRLKLDEKLDKIIQNLEKNRKVDERIKGQYPFTQLLSESDRIKFTNLDTTDKEKVASEISKFPTTDSKVIMKLWESALETNKKSEPMWLTLAPTAYKNAYNRSSDIIKENIKAKAEFFTLNTQYQINNFWETSGIIQKPNMTLNEAVLAKTPEEKSQKLDSYVANVGEQMKKWSF